MTRLLSAFGKAAAFTAKGAAVTFGSTVFSCAAACSIEKGANRMILNYCPEKLVNVESASGITQEELDYVKYTYGNGGVVAAATATATTTTNTTAHGDSRTETEDSEEWSSLIRYNEGVSFDERSISTTHATTERNSGREEEERSAVDRFWTEGEDTAAKYISMIPVIVPRQEILACSMTA